MINNFKANVRTAYALFKNVIGIRTPVFLQVKPTYNCNMACDFCNVYKKKMNELSTSDFKKIIKSVYDMGASVINFSGGEPLIRNDIVELVSFSKKLGFMTLMNTNGYYLEKYTDKLENILDYVSVSIDFSDSKVHDDFRHKKNAFNNAIRGIKASKNAGINTRINCVVSKENFDDVENVVKLAKKLSVKISLVPVLTDFEPVGTKLNINNLNISFLDYRNKMDYLKKKYSNIVTPNYFIHMNNPKCKSTDTVINVQPDGKFLLPCEVKILDYANALKFKKEYNSKKVKEFSKNNGNYNFCKDCYSQCSLTPSLLMNPLNAIKLWFNWR